MVVGEDLFVCWSDVAQLDNTRMCFDQNKLSIMASSFYSIDKEGSRGVRRERDGERALRVLQFSRSCCAVAGAD